MPAQRVRAAMRSLSRFNHPATISGLAKVIVLLAALGYFLIPRYLVKYSADLHSLEVPYVEQTCVDEESCFFKDTEFKENYEDMIANFRVFVYSEGDATYFHAPHTLSPLQASEAFFFRSMEWSPLRTMDPKEAKAFFLPFSFQKMGEKGLNLNGMRKVVGAYIQDISAKYPYWNRTSGSDHFIVSCHEMALKATQRVPKLVKRGIRIVCSSDFKDGFLKGKDLVLPQVLRPFRHPAPGSDIKRRTKLLLMGGDYTTTEIAWKNDTDREQFIISDHTTNLQCKRETEAENTSPWILDQNNSRFCMCPSGDGRLINSIHYGCVPVVWPDMYELPFSGIMNWNSFSVQMRKDSYLECDVLKILEDMPEVVYRNLHHNTIKVKKYFEWNSNPIKYDAFNLVMYQLWSHVYQPWWFRQPGMTEMGTETSSFVHIHPRGGL